MPIYSQLPDVSDIDQRIKKLQDSGMLVSNDKCIVNKKLNDLTTEVKLGQEGAKGEVVFLERQIFGFGRQVEIIPETTESNTTRPDYIVYNKLESAIIQEITEVKTRIITTNNSGWETWIKTRIKQANNQLKNSGLNYGIPGSLEMQLYENANTDFSQTLAENIDPVTKWITRGFRDNQMKSLRRVAIYGNGELLIEVTQFVVENKITRTFP